MSKIAKNSMKISHGTLTESSHICFRFIEEQIWISAYDL